MPSRSSGICKCPIELISCTGWLFYGVGLLGGCAGGYSFYCWRFLQAEPTIIYFWLAVGGVLYLAHLWEALWKARAVSYLWNVLSEEKFREHIAALQCAEPRVAFRLQCFEWQTCCGLICWRSTVVDKRLDYGAILGHTDETLSPDQTIAMFRLLHGAAEEEKGGNATPKRKRKRRSFILACTFPTRYFPRDEATQDHFEATKQRFALSTPTLQQQRLTVEESHRPCLKAALVVLTTDGTGNASRPCWMCLPVYALATLLFLNVPYRLLLYSKCRKVEWEVMKHFSVTPRNAWGAAPLHSRLHGTDVPARVWRQAIAPPPDTSPPVVAAALSDASGGPRAAGVAASEVDAASLEGVPRAFMPEVPKYWVNRDSAVPFAEMVKLGTKAVARIQELIDRTFIPVATRDRPGEQPVRLIVESVIRVEDRNMWLRYVERRAKVSSRPDVLPVRELPGSGELKTEKALSMPARGGHQILPRSHFRPSLNEAYLFHGTSPGGAYGIGKDGFQLSLAGSHAGTMFGSGAYLAEASSKSDEYASEDPAGVFAGRRALLLCRTTLGKLFYALEADAAAAERAVGSGSYDAVLGDREVVRQTYREFVVFDKDQIYPEYIVIYRHKHQRRRCCR